MPGKIQACHVFQFSLNSILRMRVSEWANFTEFNFMVLSFMYIKKYVFRLYQNILWVLRIFIFWIWPKTATLNFRNISSMTYLHLIEMDSNPNAHLCIGRFHKNSNNNRFHTFNLAYQCLNNCYEVYLSMFY